MDDIVELIFAVLEIIADIIDWIASRNTRSSEQPALDNTQTTTDPEASPIFTSCCHTGSDQKQSR